MIIWIMAILLIRFRAIIGTIFRGWFRLGFLLKPVHFLDHVLIEQFYFKVFRLVNFPQVIMFIFNHLRIRNQFILVLFKLIRNLFVTEIIILNYDFLYIL